MFSSEFFFESSVALLPCQAVEGEYALPPGYSSNSVNGLDAKRPAFSADNVDC